MIFHLTKFKGPGAVVVAQLVVQALLTPEICGSNPVISKIWSTNLYTNCMIEKTKIKKKMPGMANLKKSLRDLISDTQLESKEGEKAQQLGGIWTENLFIRKLAF